MRCQFVDFLSAAEMRIKRIITVTEFANFCRVLLYYYDHLFRRRVTEGHEMN
jgi:hypothetical protein